MSKPEPRIVSSRTEHRKARPARPNPIPGLGAKLPPLPAVPEHDVLIVEVADYGRNRGTQFLTTLEFPGDIGSAELHRRIREGSAEDISAYRAGD